MLWRVVTAKSKTNFGLIPLLFAGLLCAWVPYTTVEAVDTQIGVTVCGENASAATIDITQPINDSIVNQAITTFRGTLRNASQIEVSIDEQYVSTLAIPSNQTTFATDITLTEGTHTVLIKANDVCTIQDAADSVVVTYQPAAEFSNGGTTPTQVESGVGSEQPAAGDEDLTATQNLTQIPLIGSVFRSIDNVLNTIGIEATLRAGRTKSPVIGVARISLTVAALTSVVMASSIAPFAVHLLPGLPKLLHMGVHRSLIYIEWVIRGIGVLAMAIAYLL